MNKVKTTLIFGITCLLSGCVNVSPSGDVWTTKTARRTGNGQPLPVADGNSVVDFYISNFGTRPASHRIGQTVSVRYDPADPQKAEVDSGLSLLLVPGILFGMGVAACCLGSFFAAFGALFSQL